MYPARSCSQTTRGVTIGSVTSTCYAKQIQIHFARHELVFRDQRRDTLVPSFGHSAAATTDHGATRRIAAAFCCINFGATAAVFVAATSFRSTPAASINHSSISQLMM